MRRFLTVFLVVVTTPALAGTLNVDGETLPIITDCTTAQQQSASITFGTPGTGIVGGTGDVVMMSEGQPSLVINHSTTAISPCDQNGNATSVSSNINNRQRGFAGVLGQWRIQGFPSGETGPQKTYLSWRGIMTNNTSGHWAGYWQAMAALDGALVNAGGFDANGIFLSADRNRYRVNEKTQKLEIIGRRAEQKRPAKSAYACVDSTGHIFANPNPCN
jgi:hypothetical protein